MHAVVMESLEEYLSGALTPAAQREIEAHLGGCESCRHEIRSFQDISQLFVSMRPEEAVEPSLGFYSGVLRQVDAQREAEPAVSGLFALNFLFARRLAFASLLLLAVLGGFLLTHEPESLSPMPEAIMAQQQAPSFVSGPEHENMLRVTLTAYEPH